MHKSGESVAVQFCVSDPETSGLANADALPSAVLVKNGANNAATVAVANVATGVYSATVTLPTITDGDVLQIRVAATVGGVAGGGIVWSGEGCTKRPADQAEPITPPTVEEIDEALSETHGSGAWTSEAFPTVPTVEDIDARLSETHGEGDWGAAGVAADVWENETRTLTTPSAGTTPAASTATLTILRGDAWSVSITGLGSLVGRTDLRVTAKQRFSETDDEAALQWTESDGLVRLNGAAVATGGTLTVDDATAGDITLTLDGPAAAQLSPTRPNVPLQFDVQVIGSGGPSTKVTGTIAVTADVTRLAEI